MCHEGLAHDPVATNGAISERRMEVATDGTEFPVFVAEPQRPATGRVIIIHDIYGANDFYHDLARRFASNGFSAYLPDLFIRQGPLPEQSIEVARARGALLSYPQVLKDVANLIGAAGDGPAWGVVGFCMGGTLVMHLAASENRLTAGVVYYGFPANPNITANRPTEPMRETSLVGIPLLGFWGDQDQGVGMHNVEQYRSSLAGANKDFEFHIYPERPHGFLTFDEDSPNYEASQDSWRRALEFFNERLAS
jgi:carboxymethylenebutenolidase